MVRRATAAVRVVGGKWPLCDPYGFAPTAIASRCPAAVTVCRVINAERPRLGSALLAPESPLDDGESWEGVAASRTDVVVDGAGDIEVIGSRLAGVSFTGAELD